MVKEMRQFFVLHIPKKHFFFFAVLACAILAIFYGVALKGKHHCSKETATVLIATPALPGNIIPENLPDNEAGAFLPNVFEGLVRFKPDSCAVAPCLATSWQVSPDGRTWSFRLRPGVRFHNGRLLTAPLVAAAFERKLSAAAVSPYLRLLFGMVASVDAPDPQHVTFRLKYPYTPFLRNLALPQAAIYLPGVLPAGTGPYKIEAIRQGAVSLRAYEGYWDKMPAVARVLLRKIPDPGRRLRLLQQGKGVIALDIPLTAVSKLPPATLVKTTGAAVSYLGLYTDKEPFADPAARRTLALLIDQAALCRNLYGRLLPPATALLPPPVVGTIPQQVPGSSHQTPAGVPPILKKRPLTLLTYNEARPYNPAGGIRLAAEIKRQLAGAGIEVVIRAYPWEKLKAAIRRQEGDFFLYGWTSDNGDPDNFLCCLLASFQISRGLNATHYRNPTLDLLLARGQQIPDSPLRAQIYARALATVAADSPLIPLAYSVHLAACTPEVSGFRLHPLGTWDLQHLKIGR